MSDSERRLNQRIPFIAEVVLHLDKQQWCCELEDISLKGLLLVAPPEIERNTDKLFQVELVLDESTAIKMQASINHASQSSESVRLGMNWHNIEVESLTHLRRLLELNMDDPAEINREMSQLG